MAVLFKGVCEVEGCSRVEVARGLCRHHYNQRYKAKLKEQRSLVRYTRLCVVCGRYFECKTPQQLYDSVRCRKRMEYMRSRNPKLRGSAPSPIRVTSGSFTDDRGEIAVEGVLARESVDTSVPSEYFTQADIVSAQKGKCPKCGESILDESGCVDVFHTVPVWVIPLSEGGSKTLDNRRIFHVGCVER